MIYILSLKSIATVISTFLTFDLVLCQGSQTYDYIVVGSGASGSMVAIQLAKAGFDTVLIEAGSDVYNANFSIPIFQLRATEQDDVRWTYEVQYPFNNSNNGTSGLRSDYPRASILGGGAQIACPAHLYPSMRDFNRIVQLTGDLGWSEQSFRRRFDQFYVRQALGSPRPGGMKFLTSDIANSLKLIAPLDPKNIPLSFQLTQPSLEYLLMGYDVNGYSSGGQLNVDREQTFMMPAGIDTSSTPFKRSTIYDYLKELAHPKLHVMTNSLVSKVLIQGNTAYGIEYLAGNHLYRASPLSAFQNPSPQPQRLFARREVILSAGAINSPQLLMLSGIGDASELSRLNIPVVANLLGVGKNFHHNFELSTEFRFPSDWQIFADCTFTADSSDPCLPGYMKNSGAYTISGMLAAYILKSDQSLREPDLLQFTTFTPYNRYKYPQNTEVLTNRNAYNFVTIKADPYNTNGFVALKTSDPRDPPAITLNSFGPSNDDPDIKALIHGIRYARSIAPGRLLDLEEVRPGPHLTTDDQLAEYIRKNYWGLQPGGSVKIGSWNDAYACLDSKFRVRGIKNLRVVDSSISPKIPGFFPSIWLYLIGMKAAEDIIYNN